MAMYMWVPAGEEKTLVKRATDNQRILAEIADCPKCQEAYRLIGLRRAARLKLGQAKRMVTMQGRKAIKEAR